MMEVRSWIAAGRLAVVLVFAAAVMGTEPLAAQGVAGEEGSLRPFWHVFAAFTLAWLILFGWLVAIGRRLRRVEDWMDQDGPGEPTDA